MISTENPQPDPPCPGISQRKSSSNTNNYERVSDGNKHQLEVDLCKSGLDDNNPLPKFSIRDYAFNTRLKDIKTHWPFSPKNLQFCLKHGVKDFLPPFQTCDSVRNHSTVKSAAENISNSDVRLSVVSDHFLSVSFNNVVRKLALDVENVKYSGSEEDKENPSTLTSHCCSDINSVPSPYLEPGAENLSQSLAGKPEYPVLPASYKVGNNSRNLIKKCRSIAKLSGIAEPKPNVELSITTSVVLETMASKVCPVCKTFSSSSNTTLNAHIDQCLSAESRVKWTTNSKVVKHRIKPRKTRLIVDIYASSICCTLEDLDRRNGTNWASNSGFPEEDMEGCVDEKNNSSSSVNSEDNNGKGAVYFDSNGTKLHFGDLQSNLSGKDDYEPRKLVETDKGSKHLSSKKKRPLVYRFKLLKCPHSEERSCPPGPDHCPKVSKGQEKKFPPEEDKNEASSQQFDARDQMKSDDFEVKKQWVGSKRSSPKRKIDLEHESQHPNKIVKNLRANTNLPLVGDKFIKRISFLSFPILFDNNPLLSTETYKRKEKESLSCNSNDEYMEQPCLRKREGFTPLESRDCHGKKNSLMLSKREVKQFKKDGPMVHKHYSDPPNHAENSASSQCNKKIRRTSPDISGKGSFISTRLSQQSTISSEAKRFGSLEKRALDHGKNLLSVRRASLPRSRKKLRKKLLDFKKPRLHHMSGSDEDAVASVSADYRQDNQVKTLGRNAAEMERASCKSLIDRAKLLKNEKSRGFLNSGKEGDTTSKGSDTSPESYSLVMKNVDSFVGGRVPAGTSDVVDAVKEVETWDGFVCKLTSEVSGGEAFIASGESSDSGLPGPSGPSNIEMGSQHYVKDHEEHGSADHVSNGEPENFCADKVGKSMAPSDDHLAAEINASEVQGNYFVDVGTIPIPGPPGSFLPSPGRMDSEELNGNSSVTTCRMPYSEDEQELIQMDSSDSPVSATSLASNSVAGRSDSVSIANLSGQSHGVQHESRLDISEDRMDPAVESSTQAVDADGKLKFDDSRANLILPVTSPSRFKNNQPRCSSRKEGGLRSGSLNYQQSELLRQQTVTSVPPLPSQEKQISCGRNDKLYSTSLRSEAHPVKQPTPEAEKVVAHSPNGHATLLISPSSETEPPTYGDCESPSPSTSSSVLRLMGKNLTVVNKKENQFMTTKSSETDDHPSLRSHAVSSGNMQNEQHSFSHNSSQGSSIFGNPQSCMERQCTGFSSSDGSRIPANFRTPESSPHSSRVMLSSKSFGESFNSSLEGHEYTGGKIRMDTPIGYAVDKVHIPILQLNTIDSSCGKHGEIIVINDLPDNEVSLAFKATDGKVTKEAGGSSVRIPASGASGYDSRYVSPSYTYQTRCFPYYIRSQMAQNANIQVQPSKGMKEYLANWNLYSRGSSVPHPESLTAGFHSAGHLSSALHFSPGFSVPKTFTP